MVVAVGAVPETRRLGEFGEGLACTHLESRGFRVLERNYRRREGEIDIVASRGDVLAFVEVRTRRGSRMGTAAESVTGAKAERMFQMAEAYASERQGLPPEHRIDLVAIDFEPGGKLAALRHIENAVQGDWFGLN
jgi:putative endonuclease